MKKFQAQKVKLTTDLTPTNLSSKFTINLKDKFIEANKTNKKKKPLSSYIALGVGATLFASMILPEIALAAATFNIDAGVTAATTPLTTAITNHWGKIVMLTTCASAIMGEGDARQRGVIALKGAAISGGAILGIIALFT